MTKVMNREALDAAGCGTPNCTHDHSILYLVPKCHGGPVEVHYNKKIGEIVVQCAECGKLVARIAL
jgi:hypothetical protein